RDDLDPALESLLGDALGPGSWLDVIRQTVSTYAWDGWADLDPDEIPRGDGMRPGAARRCLARLLQLAGPESSPQTTHHSGETEPPPPRHSDETGPPSPCHNPPPRHSSPPRHYPPPCRNPPPRHSRESGNPSATIHPRSRRDDPDEPTPSTPPPPVSTALDIGCGTGRTTFDLAAHYPAALLLGIDLNLSLLRLARQALAGTVSYPRRRIGLVYDRRRFPVAPTGAGRVDFWACDALALPFAPGVADLTVALNVLDCVAEPARLLAELAAATRSGGRLLLASPYDWSTRATPVETWIGGHSQRADHAGAAEAFLRTLLTEGAHPRSVPGLRLIGEELDWPWQTRLHDRSSVQYRSHLLALQRN
ncbi:MAG TPA: methyltransferase domain-containing protein, partial [Acetobacteraceae bacterium]